MSKKSPHVGKLPALYNFFLNPSFTERYALCPQCEEKTEQKKVPLVIHVDPDYPVSLNYTCTYCAKCDLLIAHQREIESILTQMFLKINKKIIGHDYMVMGTVNHDYWKQGTKSPDEVGDLGDKLHGFKEYLDFEKGNDRKGSSKKSTVFSKPDSTQELISMMKSHLPIAVRVEPVLLPSLRHQGMPISAKQSLYIHAVFDGGSEAGITCDITPSTTKKKNAVILSLTFLEVIGDTSLAKAMRSYQKERKAKLAR